MHLLLTLLIEGQKWSQCLCFTRKQFLYRSSSTEDDIIDRHALIGRANERQRQVVLPYEAVY